MRLYEYIYERIDMEKLYTPAEVANYIGVTRETVYSMISRGQLDAFRFGRSRRISEQQLKESMSRRYQVVIDATQPNAAFS
jgi:excisionase family DNA binding protein